MILYHGTAAKNIPAILEHGIQPRRTGHSNYDNLPSHPEAVYLSRMYAPHYAQHAVEDGADETEWDTAVFMVNTRHLDPVMLVPDEDAIAHDMQEPTEERILKEREKLALYVGTHRWRASVRVLGNCAYFGVIPPAAITAYARISYAAQIEHIKHGMDPCVGPMNVRLYGKRHASYSRWLFTESARIPAGIVPFTRHDKGQFITIPRDGVEATYLNAPAPFDMAAAWEIPACALR